MTDVVLERRGARRRAGGEEARVQITRLLSLLATGLVLLFGLLLRVTNPGATDPMWLRLVLATLLMAFAGGTYVSGTLRRWCVEISWGFLYLLLGWAVVMAGLSGLPGEYALGVLLVYAISGTLILLSSRSMKPVLAFLVVGLLLGSGLLWSASSPETSPAALALSLLSVAALEGTAGRWVIRMRDRFLRQEKELERKNDLLERTQEIADVGAWEYDAASGDAIWTEQVRRITGHPPEAGRCLENVIEVYHPEDRSRVREALGRALENGEPFDLEARIVSRDEERWVNLQGESQRAGEIQLNGSEPRSNGRPEKDAGGGDVARLRGTIQDITERKQREEALRRQKNLLEQTQRLAGGWQVDLETGTVIGSGEFYRIYEMEGEEGPRAFALEDALQFFTDEARPELREALRRCAEQGEPYDLELQIDTAKGNRRWVRTVGAPVETSGGEVTKVAGALQDITERKQRERILQRRRQTIASLYDVTKRLLRAESREAVLGRIHEVLRAVFDYPFFHTASVDGDLVVPGRTEAAGDLRLPEPEPRPRKENFVAARALREGRAVVIEDVDALDNPVDYGDLRAAVGVPIGKRGAIVAGKAQEGGFDQTDLRLLEVLGSYAALVLSRLEREEQLPSAKEEAEEAKEEAQQANHLKSAFLANISHEIRTPLTSIIGFAEIIGSEAEGLDLPESPLPGHASTIEQSGKRLLETLDGVLNLSKLQSGQMELETRPVDLAEQVRLAVEELRPRAEEKGLGLELETGPAAAEADEGGVQIVLRNLLSNAIKYTGEGGTVRVRSLQDEGRAVLEVEDTGIGMDPEAAERLFEPFRQASEGFGREYEGAGVGLAVTSEAVAQMGGSIEVETEKGEGTRFTVFLPAASELS